MYLKSDCPIILGFATTKRDRCTPYRTCSDRCHWGIFYFPFSQFRFSVQNSSCQCDILLVGYDDSLAKNVGIQYFVGAWDGSCGNCYTGFISNLRRWCCSYLSCNYLSSIVDVFVGWWGKDHLFSSGLHSGLIGINLWIKELMKLNDIVIIIIIRDRGLFKTPGAQALADIFRIC